MANENIIVVRGHVILKSSIDAARAQCVLSACQAILLRFNVQDFVMTVDTA
jgi:hypothetical protein